MDPVTIGIGAGLLALSLGWRWLKHRKPKLAAKLTAYERELKAYAGDAFRAVELLGAAVGWSGAEKLAEYRRRVERFTTLNGIPTGLGDIDERLEEWARDWSVSAKLDPEVADATRRIAELYEANTAPMKLGMWRGTP